MTRKKYVVVRRPDTNYPLYDAYCEVCSFVSRGWDYRRNAVRTAVQHRDSAHTSKP